MLPRMYATRRVWLRVALGSLSLLLGFGGCKTQTYQEGAQTLDSRQRPPVTEEPHDDAASAANSHVDASADAGALPAPTPGTAPRTPVALSATAAPASAPDGGQSTPE